MMCCDSFGCLLYIINKKRIAWLVQIYCYSCDGKPGKFLLLICVQKTLVELFMPHFREMLLTYTVAEYCVLLITAHLVLQHLLEMQTSWDGAQRPSRSERLILATLMVYLCIKEHRS